MSNEDIFTALSMRPNFHPEQQSWPAEDRVRMLGSLKTFMVPLPRHLHLAAALDSMIRRGYVGRGPRTKEHAQRYQSIYENKHLGVVTPEGMRQDTAQLSMLLMGLSGMGKTSCVKRLFSHIPQVIFHPELNIYQVTYLHVEMPSDGSSIKGLAHGILAALDKLFPDQNYYYTYAIQGKPSADALMRSVSALLNCHHVGFLVADEIQNLTNAYKGKEVVMTQLVSACNEMSVPILFIGTPKARKVFSLAFRQSRRACGNAWGPLSTESEGDNASEWEIFLDVLWSFQWVQNPVALDAQFRALMLHYSCGVIDIAIRLFASAQARAIIDGIETLTPEVLNQVYLQEMHLLHPMLDALRSGDLERLSQYEDIAMDSMDEMIESQARRLRAKTMPAFRKKSDEELFAASIAGALQCSGFDKEDSAEVAAEVAANPKVTNLAEGTVAAIATLSTPRKLAAKKEPKTGKGKQVEQELISEITAREGDYRNGIVQAKLNGTKIVTQLQAAGLTPKVNALLDLT